MNNYSILLVDDEEIIRKTISVDLSEQGYKVTLSESGEEAIKKLEDSGVYIYNLGTGKGYSVLETVKAFEKASGKKIPYKIVKRRPGDIAVNYADPLLAKKELGWEAKRDIDKMCEDTWRWQSKNPEGL